MSEMVVNRGLVNKMRYFRGVRHGYGVPYASDSWGSFEYFIEIDDQYVSRQVNRFEYGELLRYDRQHWCDEFGMMFVRRFSRKQKASRGHDVITDAEFERIWQQSLESSNWTKQQETARMHLWGTWSDRTGE